MIYLGFKTSWSILLIYIFLKNHPSNLGFKIYQPKVAYSNLFLKKSLFWLWLYPSILLVLILFLMVRITRDLVYFFFFWKNQILVKSINSGDWFIECLFQLFPSWVCWTKISLKAIYFPLNIDLVTSRKFWICAFTVINEKKFYNLNFEFSYSPKV